MYAIIVVRIELRKKVMTVEMIEYEIAAVKKLIEHGSNTGQDQGAWMFNLETELSVLTTMLEEAQ